MTEDIYPLDLKYTKDHEWVKTEKDVAIIGITNYAQEELGDIVFVELPEAGTMIEQKEELCVIESVKTVSNIYAPISGQIIEVNDNLSDSPETINESPYENGWIATIAMSDEKELDDLMTVNEYENFIDESSKE